MARRQSSRPRSTRSRQEAPAKARRSSAPVAPAVVVAKADDGSGGMTGMAILTTVLLVAAFLCVDAMRGGYGEGLFF